MKILPGKDHQKKGKNNRTEETYCTFQIHPRKSHETYSCTVFHHSALSPPPSDSFSAIRTYPLPQYEHTPIYSTSIAAPSAHNMPMTNSPAFHGKPRRTEEYTPYLPPTPSFHSICKPYNGIPAVSKHPRNYICIRSRGDLIRYIMARRRDGSAYCPAPHRPIFLRFWKRFL